MFFLMICYEFLTLKKDINKNLWFCQNIFKKRHTNTIHYDIVMLTEHIRIINKTVSPMYIYIFSSSF